MAKKTAPPKFEKKQITGLSPEMEKLGLELSKSLPTFDVPIDLIEANDWNPNEMKDETFNRLVEELEENGIIDPIQIVPAEGGKFRIIGGEHRWAGAKTLGWTSIPANVLTDERFVDEDLQKLITVRLNVIHGEMNPEKFTSMYQDMAEKYGVDQLKALFGRGTSSPRI
jgi:ParB-like chromosome segregation protein Spo0J